ncbi:ATPase, T2SS/T4P/T4SS family [Bacillus cereus]|nr:ATPase, T2SS/T4P/T4SS family [Bacillus cereus]MEC3260908.1 ATPase, T2SS/T4P/T4SS family [Bacillus cereus]
MNIRDPKTLVSGEGLGLNAEAFDPNKWLEGRGNTNYKKSHKSFENVCEQIKKDVGDHITNTDVVNHELLELQHKAVIGDKQAMNHFILKIKTSLEKFKINSSNVEYPDFYDSLEQAIFQEIWGVSILYKWEKYPHSEAAVIRGTKLWIDINGKFEQQEEEFRDIEHVERVRRTFTLRTEDSIINSQNPELEIEREDGSRITMLQKPRSRTHYIMFRRFIVKNLSLENQAELGTIRKEDIPIFRALSKTMCNIGVVGRVRSAKSTFLKSLVLEREPHYIAAVMEKHFELGLSEAMPDRLIFEVQAKEGDLHIAMPRLLRMEHDYIIVGEIRSLETEGYLQATERGERGCLFTYHVTDVSDIAPQMTRHLLDSFPNRKYEYELERVARNTDIIITMGTDRDRRKKRVEAVTEIIWDNERKECIEKDLIRYSKAADKYFYSSEISRKLLLLMADESFEQTKLLISLLRDREKESPMTEYHDHNEEILEELLGKEHA